MPAMGALGNNTRLGHTSSPQLEDLFAAPMDGERQVNKIP